MRVYPVHQPMFLRNSPRPKPGEIPLQRFRLACAFEWVALTLLKQLIQLPQPGFVVFLPVAALLEGIR